MRIVAGFGLLACLLSTTATADDVKEFVGKKFSARDTLGEIEEMSPDARKCLEHHHWAAAEFDVECESGEGKPGAYVVRFPSPIDTRNPTNDRVAMEWYVARDESLKPIKAPAVVVVHESG